jgi:hypothetical protein
MAHTSVCRHDALPLPPRPAIARRQLVNNKPMSRVFIAVIAEKTAGIIGSVTGSSAGCIG